MYLILYSFQRFVLLNSSFFLYIISYLVLIQSFNICVQFRDACDCVVFFFIWLIKFLSYISYSFFVFISFQNLFISYLPKLISPNFYYNWRCKVYMLFSYYDTFYKCFCANCLQLCYNEIFKVSRIDCFSLLLF